MGSGGQSTVICTVDVARCDSVNARVSEDPILMNRFYNEVVSPLVGVVDAPKDDVCSEVQVVKLMEWARIIRLSNLIGCGAVWRWYIGREYSVPFLESNVST